MKKISILFLLLLSNTYSFSQPGSLDQTFGQNGKVVTAVGVEHNLLNKVLIQQDAKIVTIGYSTQAQYSGKFCLIRYKSDGQKDNSFGDNGVVETQFGDGEDVAAAGVIQPDGKIIASGYSWNGSNYDFAMVRYHTNGTLDDTFGVGGIVKTDLYGQSEQANCIVLQPDGTILLAGYSEDQANFDLNIAVAKYNVDGTLYEQFGDNGKVIIALGETGNFGEPGFWQVVRSMKIQQDGKILLTGFTEFFEANDQMWEDVVFVMRMNGNGRLDVSFGNEGVVITKLGIDDVGADLAVQLDGKILVLGKTRAVFGGYEDLILMRYNANGILDNAFGNNGVVKTSFSNTDDIGNSMVLQPDQKILALGFTAVNNGSTLDFALARFNTDGSLDNSFDNDGRITTDFGGNWDIGISIAVQKNGKIVAGGYTLVNSEHKFAIARYNNDQSLPVKLTSFEATKNENKVILNWKTEAEVDSDLFEIQRSLDGKQWERLSSIKAFGNSQSARTYQFTDLHPQGAQNLYRLKMIDLDQSYSYSKIESILFEKINELAEVVIYPNPARERVHLQVSNWNIISSADLFDKSGQNVFHSDVPVSEIDVKGFSSGVYTLVLTNRDGSKISAKVVLNK